MRSERCINCESHTGKPTLTHTRTHTGTNSLFSVCVVGYRIRRATNKTAKVAAKPDRATNTNSKAKWELVLELKPKLELELQQLLGMGVGARACGHAHKEIN